MNILSSAFDLLRRTAVNIPLIGSIVTSLLYARYELDPEEACRSLATTFDFSSLNTTVTESTYFVNTTRVSVPGAYAPITDVGSGVCRVQFVVNTSAISFVKAEAWLPKEWSGRTLTIGNGGLGGFIDYDNLGYGTSLGFASMASNNGHDGNTGKFFSNPEILEDFARRSIHVSTVAGKKIVESFYERRPRRTYYTGCSTGGRQGIYSAVHFPNDFDGILAGAPAINFNMLLGWTGMLTRYVGAPYPEKSPGFIPRKMWDVISAEVLRQCDGLDGVQDGIITEPDACEFRPEELLCAKGRSPSGCLTLAQVETLRKIYEPLHGPNGEYLISGFTPGAELSWLAQGALFSGKPFAYTDEWMTYAIHKSSNFTFSEFGMKDILLSEKIDPGEISTFSGDLAAFRARGGKLISYHGRKDDVIPSHNSKLHYNKVARTLHLHSSAMDDFYRLFLIPGLEHCWSGPGAVRFGQTSREVPVGDTEAGSSPGKKRPDNILLALVEWVEKGRAPATIMGQSEDGKSTREHCRYPQRSVWNGNEFVCVR